MAALSVERSAATRTASALPTALTTSVIVLTYNTREYVSECLRSIARQSRRPDEVIVVDNASTDGTADEVGRYDWVKLLVEPENLGCPGGFNAGARAAKGDVLVFVNEDVSLDARWLEELLKPLETDPTVDAAQSLILLHDEPDLINTSGHEVNMLGVAWCGQYRQPRPAAQRGELLGMSGASFAIRSEAFWGVGGFDADYFMGHDDIDLSWRLRLAGRRLVLAPNSLCYHRYHFTKPTLHKMHLTERNRLATVFKVYRWPTIVALLPMLAAFELGTCVFAAGEGTLPGKLRGYRDLYRTRRRLLEKRRAVQESRRLRDADLKRWLVGRLEYQEMRSPLISAGSVVSSLYWRLVRPLIAW